jgi:hypothetical protein
LCGQWRCGAGAVPRGVVDVVPVVRAGDDEPPLAAPRATPPPAAITPLATASAKVRLGSEITGLLSALAGMEAAAP